MTILAQPNPTPAAPPPRDAHQPRQMILLSAGLWKKREGDQLACTISELSIASTDSGGCEEMSDADIPPINFDNRLDSYASFFDHDWAAQFMDRSAQTKLAPAAYLLCRDWKGIALSSRMSWLMVHSLHGFQKEIWQYKTPQPKQMIQAVVDVVTKSADIRHMAKKRIVQEANALVEKFEEALRSSPPAINPESIWQSYLGVKEIPWALWASQWLTYSSLYFSYENFIRATVGLGQGDPNFRHRNIGSLCKAMAALFDEGFAAACINRRDVKIIREARHCLVHNGGLESTELRDLKHSIRVVHGYLQVFPEDAHAAYNCLKSLALKIAVVAQSNSAFIR